MKKEKQRSVKYKIRMVVDICGEVTATDSLREENGIEPYIQWAVEDIAKALSGECDIVGVKKIELEEIEG